MNDLFWERFLAVSKVNCLEMKNQIQARIESETRSIAPNNLTTYFREASRRFWMEMEQPYPSDMITTPESKK